MQEYLQVTAVPLSYSITYLQADENVRPKPKGGLRAVPHVRGARVLVDNDVRVSGDGPGSRVLGVHNGLLHALPHQTSIKVLLRS